MTIQSAIEKAIEGGYELNIYDWVEHSGEEKSTADILLDPAFWQALGKVEGWGESMKYVGHFWGWRAQMHRLIDALAKGKSIEQFFETL